MIKLETVAEDDQQEPAAPVDVGVQQQRLADQRAVRRSPASVAARDQGRARFDAATSISGFPPSSPQRAEGTSPNRLPV
jgi:hypothetical protein